MAGAHHGGARRAIANVALPVIAHQLGASPASSVWVINAYQLTITILLLPLATLGDRIGYKCIYLPGLALFTLGSVGCAAGGTLTLLIAARVFQGIGAALYHEQNAALVRATYPAKMLGRGIGYNAMVLSMSAAIGPTLAAIILSVASWQWLFLINLPNRDRCADRRSQGSSRPARAGMAGRSIGDRRS